MMPSLSLVELGGLARYSVHSTAIEKIRSPIFVYVRHPTLDSKWLQQTKLSDDVGRKFWFIDFHVVLSKN